MWWIALFLGCRAPVTDCLPGFEAGNDGLCYEVSDDSERDPATVDDVLANLPDCEPVTADGRIDLDAGCADGACAGMTFAEINEALGEVGACTWFRFETSGYGFSSADCSWPGGIEASFDDDDSDGEPDSGSEAFALYLTLPYDGGTAEGLGLGVNLRCFVDALGEPEAVSFEQDGGGWLPDWMYWSGLSASDRVDNKTGDYGSDGKVDALSLYRFR